MTAPPLKKAASKGLIVVGRLPEQEDIHAILKLAAKLQWPVCADVLSNARSFPTKEQIKHFDFIDKPTPELVLHFGERLTSKKMLEWLKKVRPEIIHISPYPSLQDPERLLVSRVQSSIPEFCDSFLAKSDPNWITLWQKEPKVPDHFLTEIEIPEGFSAFFGSGLSIREADHFFYPKHPCPVFANRGLSGIDGNIATVAGLAETSPVFAMIGDQAALYDINSLPLIKESKYPVILFIVNNFGGKIFEQLPVAKSPDFEKYWLASHDYRFEKAAEMFNIPYREYPDCNWEKTSIIEFVHAPCLR